MFDYISDKKIRDVCNSDFNELEKCIKLNLSKSALILIGSLVESLLYYEIINNNKYKDQLPNFEKRDEKSLTLDKLLNDAHKIKIISDEMFYSLKNIQSYRNYIHPNVYIKKETMPNSINIQSCYYILKSLIDLFNNENKQHDYPNEILISIRNLFSKLYFRIPTDYEMYLYCGFALKYPIEIVEKIILSEVKGER